MPIDPLGIETAADPLNIEQPARHDPLGVETPPEEGYKLSGRVMADDVPGAPHLVVSGFDSAADPGGRFAKITAPLVVVPEIAPAKTGLARLIYDARNSKAGQDIFGPIVAPSENGFNSDIERQGALPTVASIPARVANFGGKLAKAAVGDIAATVSSNPDAGGNVREAFAGRGKTELPVETQVAAAKAEANDQQKTGWDSIAADISLGIADLAPKIAMIEAAPAGVAQGAVSAGVFGFDEQNQFHPVNAVVAAAFPAITKATAQATDAAIKNAVDAGASWAGNPYAQKALHVAANQAAMNAVITAQSAPELIQLAKTDPTEFKRQLATIIGSNLAFAIPEALKSFEPVQKTEPTAAPETSKETRRAVTVRLGDGEQRKPETPILAAPQAEPVANLSKDSLADLQATLQANQIKAPVRGERYEVDQAGPRPESRSQNPERGPIGPVKQGNERQSNAGQTADVFEGIGQELGGISHLGNIIESAARTYADRGPEEGKVYLEEQLRTAFDRPDGGEGAYPGDEIFGRTVDEFDAAIRGRLEKNGIVLPNIPLPETAPRETTVADVPAETAAPAETGVAFTGHNEQKGSDAPEATTLASEQMPAEVPAISGAKTDERPPQTARPLSSPKKSFFLGGRSDGVPDILDSIQELGGIQPPGKYSGGEYDGFREAMTGPARLLIKKSAVHRPDTIIAELQSVHAPGANRMQSADDLYNAIRAAVKSRDALKTGDRVRREELKQVSEFQRRAISGDRPKKDQGKFVRVPVGKMLEGDTFEVQGHKFEVKHLEFDENGNLISLEVMDGPKFGVQRVDADEFIHVDKGSFGAGPEHDAGVPNDLTPAAGPADAKAFDKAMKYLESLKTDTRGQLHAFGLVPEVWNKLIDMVMLGLRGGRKIADAVQWAIDRLYDQHPNLQFDEAGAREYLNKTPLGNLRYEQEQKIEPGEANSGERPEKPNIPPEKPAPKSYDELRQRIREADDELRKAIRLTGSKEARVNAGKSIEQARAEKNLAAAKFHNLRDELLRTPEYISDLLREQDTVMRRLKLSEPKPEGEERVQLELRAEDLQNELNEAPKKLVAKLADDLFFRTKPTASETAARRDAVTVPASTEVAKPGAEEVGAEKRGELMRQRLSELPIRARELFKGVNDTRKKIAAKLATMPNRQDIAVGKDAADNKAMMIGKQTGNLILHELNRAFGATGDRVSARNEARENALTFVIESGRDQAVLQHFKELIETSPHRFGVWAGRALDAIRYAERHWERFQKVAQMYEALTDTEVEVENQAGISTLHRKGGYVFHLQDVMANWALPNMAVSSGGGAAAPFNHGRDHPTYADAIAAGVVPKSLNAVDLLQRRMMLGRKLVNYRAWIDSLRKMVDPKTQLPVLTDPTVRMKADGTSDVTAPAGYKLDQFAGQQIAVHKGYDGIFSALTGQSWFAKGTIRPGLMKSAATTKHLVLLFDSYHLGRMAFWNAMVRGAGDGVLSVLPGNPAAYKKGLTLLDNTMTDIRAMADRGEIPKEWLDGLSEQKRQLDLLMTGGLNVGSAADNIYSDWIQHLPLAGRFNRWLFQKFVRGAMTEAGLIEFARQQRGNPHLSETQVARQVAKDLNLRFGNLNNQSWIKSQTGRDLARLLILAPSWNESLMRSELTAVKQLALAPVQSWRAKRLTIGTIGRATAAAVLGQFIANQILNYITRRKPTWENPEEESTAKLSAYIPDVVGNGPGFFLNPLVLPAEISDLLLKKTERTGDFSRAAREFAASRLHMFGRAGYTFITREDSGGAKLKGGVEVGGEMLSNLVPLPLSGGAVARAGKQLVTGEPEEKYPGQFQRQAFQTFGVKLDSAPSDEQRIRALAKEFNAEKGITPDPTFFHGDYFDLDRALLLGNQREIRRAIQELLTKKRAGDIVRHYKQRASAPFTGQKVREQEFLITLTPEQRQVYQRARQRRERLRDEVSALLQNLVAAERAPAE